MGYPIKTPLIIEFFGLPGCGKSTLAHLLQKIITNDNNVNIVYPPKQTSLEIYKLFLFPRYIKYIIRLFSFANCFDRKRHPLLILLPLRFLKLYHNFYKINQQDILLVDQGVVQGLISLAHTDPIYVTNDLYFFIKSLNNLPLVLINCHCSLETSKKRMKERTNGCSRVEHFQGDTLNRVLQNQIDNIDCLRDLILESCPQIHIIDVNTEHDTTVNIELISEYLKQFSK